MTKWDAPENRKNVVHMLAKCDQCGERVIASDSNRSTCSKCLAKPPQPKG